MIAVKLTPTEVLMGDVLAARFRTGENLWTFDSKLARQGSSLQTFGLIGMKSGIVEKTFQAWLTDAGKDRFLDPGYTPPAFPKDDRLWHSRNAEGFIEKALAASFGSERDIYLRVAEIHASLARAAAKS